MTYVTNNITQESLTKFQGFEIDTQLAILWFGYKDIKDQLKPHNTFSVTDPARALFDQIKALPQEQQLQAQRDIAAGADTDVSRAYSSLSSSSQLELWLLLAQGMEQGTVIQVPADYELPAKTHEFVESIQKLDFEQRLNFMRSAVIKMGARPR